MSRLIDADKLKETINSSLNTGREAFSPEIIREAIDEQPTAFDVDKVAERLEEYLFEKYCIEGDTKIDEIVKGGGIE